MTHVCDPWRVEHLQGGTYDLRRAIGLGLIARGFIKYLSADELVHTTNWPAWARETYFTVDNDEVVHVRALAEGPPGPRELLDAAYALGGKNAIAQILRDFREGAGGLSIVTYLLAKENQQ